MDASVSRAANKEAMISFWDFRAANEETEIPLWNVRAANEEVAITSVWVS